MKQLFDDSLGRVLSRWVAWVVPRRRWVLSLVSLVSVVAAVYAVQNLGVNTDPNRVVSGELPYRQLYKSFSEAFPILDDALLVVVDASTPYDAGQAALALAERLEANPAVFQDVFVPGEGEFFHRHALLYLSTEELEELADKLVEFQPLLAELARDGSLHGLLSMFSEAADAGAIDMMEDIEWAPLLDRIRQGVEAVLDEDTEASWWHSLLYEEFFPQDRPRRVIITLPVLDYDSLLPAREAILAVREATSQLGLEAEGVTVGVTGNVALSYEEMFVIGRQALLTGAVSMVIVAVILTIGLSSPRLIFAILATLFAGLTWTGAFAAAVVGHVNMISAAFAVLFIGLGVDFGIHMGMRYAELVRSGFDTDEAIHQATQSVGGSLGLCAATTAVGFYVFLPTEFRAVAELGLISGTGMFVSLFCNVTVLPALLAVGGGGVRPDHRRWLDTVDDAISHFPERHPRLVRGTAAIVGLGAIALLPYASFDHDIIKLRDPASQSVITFNELLQDRETSPWYIDVLAKDVTTARSLQAELDTLDVVDKTITILDYIPEEQEEKLEILMDVAMFLPVDPSFEAASPPATTAQQVELLRELRDAVSESWAQSDDVELARAASELVVVLDRLLADLAEGGRAASLIARLESELVGPLPEQLRHFWKALDPSEVEFASLPPELIDRMMGSDGRARIQVLPKYDVRDREQMERFVDSVHVVVPEASGSAVTVLEAARVVVRSLQQALLTATAVIAVLLVLLWRRLSDALLVMIPLSLAALMTGASSVLFDTSFNFANVIVLPLLLGIGVDSGIHLVHRYRLTRDAGGEILRTSTARAVLFSALTTIGSFGTLTFSSHGGLASLGQLLTLGVFYMLVANLLVLPALLTFRFPRRAETSLSS